MKPDDDCGFIIKKIAKFTTHEGKQSHGFRLVPEVIMFFFCKLVFFLLE